MSAYEKAQERVAALQAEMCPNAPTPERVGVFPHHSWRALEHWGGGSLSEGVTILWYCTQCRCVESTRTPLTISLTK